MGTERARHVGRWGLGCLCDAHECLDEATQVDVLGHDRAALLVAEQRPCVQRSLSCLSLPDRGRSE